MGSRVSDAPIGSQFSKTNPGRPAFAANRVRATPRISGIDRPDPDRAWRRAAHVGASPVEPDLAVADHRALVADEQPVGLLLENRPPDPRRKDLMEVAFDR